MPKTLIDVDEVLLQKARELTGARTKKETVNAALAELVALYERRQDIAWLKTGGARAMASQRKRAAAWRR